MDDNLSGYVESLIIENDDKTKKIEELSVLVEELNNTVYALTEERNRMDDELQALFNKNNSLLKERKIYKKLNNIKPNKETPKTQFIKLNEEQLSNWMIDYANNKNNFSKMSTHMLTVQNINITLKNTKNTLNFIMFYYITKNNKSDIPDKFKQLFFAEPFDCHMCLDEKLMIDKKYTMKCGHSICIDCMKELNKTNVVKCPFCRTRFKKNSTIVANHFTKLVKSVLK